MNVPPEKLLPVQPAHQLPVRTEAQRWLVTGLWLEQAVGMLGGEPKCCKSFLALDLAVAVASGTACLRQFPVPTSGRVLLYAAEDALHIVRRRLEGICAAAQVSFEDLDVQVITAPTVRLDLPADRERLERTVETLKPRLLVLDPFVRLHRIDENASGEVAPLLAYLRELQRRHAISVLVVHHAKKGGARIRAGQALRGSSELHAWGDSNLYLRRTENQLTLTVEHRAAPSLPPIDLELTQRGESLALEIRASAQPTPEPPAPTSVDERILKALRDADHPLSAAKLRARCSVRKATFYARLEDLTRAGRLLHSPEGYRLAQTV
jgi:RecA-family ATPase